MAKQLFSNISSAPLAVSVVPGDLTIQVGAGLGVIFPNPTGGDWFIGCLEDSGGNVEYFKCTARSGDLLTVQRGQEGSTAQSFTNTVTRVELRNTKGSMERMFQKSGDQMEGDLNLGGFDLVNGTLGANVSVPNTLVFPVGMITMWSGAIGSIPAGWALCDGANGTPDLRNRFIVGAGSSYAVGATGGTISQTAPTDSAGSHSHSGTTGAHTLTVGEIPPHTHLVGARGSNASTNNEPKDFIDDYPGQNSNVLTSETGGGQAHSHTISSDGTHSHSVTMDVRPPYFALAYIMFTGT